MNREGCIGYSYATDVLDPTKLIIVEKWVDDAALAFHFQTPHMAAFQAALSLTFTCTVLFVVAVVVTCRV